jgi:hypothetical protein
MKDELRSESRGGNVEGRKNQKAHFSARLMFLSFFRWAANREAQSSSVKPRQTSSVGQAGRHNPCKSLIMNIL